MKLSTLPSRLGAFVGFGAILCSFGVLAGPAVNVALEASFSAGPYLLELL